MCVHLPIQCPPVSHYPKIFCTEYLREPVPGELSWGLEGRPRSKCCFHNNQSLTARAGLLALTEDPVGVEASHIFTIYDVSLIMAFSKCSHSS